MLSLGNGDHGHMLDCVVQQLLSPVAMKVAKGYAPFIPTSRSLTGVSGVSVPAAVATGARGPVVVALEAVASVAVARTVLSFGAKVSFPCVRLLAACSCATTKAGDRPRSRFVTSWNSSSSGGGIPRKVTFRILGNCCCCSSCCCCLWASSKVFGRK